MTRWNRESPSRSRKRRSRRRWPKRDLRTIRWSPGKRAKRKLGDEHGTGGIEPLDDRGIFVDFLVLETTRTPGGGIPGDREQIFRAPWQAVKRAAIGAFTQVGIGLARVSHGALFSEGDDEMEQRVVALEAAEVHLGERDGADLFAADELSQLHDGGEG